MIKDKYFDEEEVVILKSLFVENTTFFYLFRKLFFETVTADELDKLKKVLKDVPEELIVRTLVGGVSADNPIGQHRDLMHDQMQIDNLHPELIDIQLDGRVIMQSFLIERIDALFGNGEIVTTLDTLLDGRTSEERASNIKARSLVIKYIDNLYVMTKTIANGDANLTTEQIMERQKKNSSK